MNSATQGGAVSNAPIMTSLKMKGLPFTVTRDEILNFFQGSNMIEDSVKIGVYPDGRLTGAHVRPCRHGACCWRLRRLL